MKNVSDFKWPEKPFHVALVEPEIPPNTGNIARLCAATGSTLHLVGQLGFRLTDRELKRAGLDYHEYAGLVVHKDWAAWAKDMDEFNFDMTWAAWGAGIFKDPEHMWASREARRQGSNITGFSNPEVDVLIEKQKTIFDIRERHAICRDIDRRVTGDYPYILLWNINYTRLLYWNKFGVPPTILGKYANESSAPWLWWYDEDSSADLQDAMKTGTALPPRKDKMVFDEVFKPGP